ncbi:MAG: hypothetical protein IJ251_07335 [Oscillospiraceae bacterium]|nr:hypothetical protein [Oscillospiraceae bacterium]
MRRANTIIAAAILILFIIHGVFGAYQMMGLGYVNIKWLAYVMVVLIVVHAVIGFYLSAKTHKIQKKSGVEYKAQNRLFWARRDSGIAIMLFLAVHFISFTHNTDDGARLYRFDTFRLIGNILLVVSVGLHVLTNIRPLMISLGIKKAGSILADVLFVMSIVLIVMAVGFIVYFIRWNVM